MTPVQQMLYLMATDKDAWTLFNTLEVSAITDKFEYSLFEYLRRRSPPITMEQVYLETKSKEIVTYLIELHNLALKKELMQNFRPLKLDPLMHQLLTLFGTSLKKLNGDA